MRGWLCHLRVWSQIRRARYLSSNGLLLFYFTVGHAFSVDFKKTSKRLGKVSKCSKITTCNAKEKCARPNVNIGASSITSAHCCVARQVRFAAGERERHSSWVLDSYIHLTQFLRTRATRLRSVRPPKLRAKRSRESQHLEAHISNARIFTARNRTPYSERFDIELRRSQI